MRTIVLSLFAATAITLAPTQVTSTDTTVERIPVNACKYEDGSHSTDAGGCYWDAGRRGNKRGFSYWIDKRGDVHYLNPKKGR